MKTFMMLEQAGLISTSHLQPIKTRARKLSAQVYLYLTIN